MVKRWVLEEAAWSFRFSTKWGC